MAVTPTGAIYKSLNFDGKTSREFGVYITGEAVYNAPERDVEMITIPGRNGAFALDNGRFQNIEVSYPAGIFSDDEASFADAISDFRNFLCSRKGYCRLTDEYNPDEYREAIYKSGLEVDPALLRAGEFTITFECKPQRWLNSGKTKQTIANSGDTITNPTRFESKPLLEVEGYGNIELNGYEIELINETMGEVSLFNKTEQTIGTTATANLPSIVFNADLLNNGDAISITSKLMNGIIGALLNYNAFGIDAPYYYKVNGLSSLPTTETNLVYRLIDGPYKFIVSSNAYDSTVRVNVQAAQADFYKGTPSTFSATYTHDINIVDSSYNILYAVTLSIAITIDYDGDDTINITITRTILNDSLGVCKIIESPSIPSKNVNLSGGVGTSTISMLGNPTYLDCDLGEAYKIIDNTPISLNQYIDLGSKLPELNPGSNTITFDNTITNLKITPRWWKV